MKAYQIVIKGNSVSEEYARISRESYQPAIDAGIIDEIIVFDAITPDSPDFEEHVGKYKWEASNMIADLEGSRPDDHSPTEKAGMCSHWELMRMASETDEKFLVLEHDSYLHEFHRETFRALIEYTEEMNPLYVNIGMFMGCYYIEKESAKYMYYLLTEGSFPINCGPYCTLQRLYSTYTTNYLKKCDYRGIDITLIHPWHECATLHFGRNVQKPFNEKDPFLESNPWKNPTTQVVSKSLAVTQDHHGYKRKHIDHPWTRHPLFKVID